jgi:hypothetical protein
MSKIQDNIIEIQLELSKKINKSEFLAECALKKIESRSKTYNESLDKYLEFLDTKEINSKDLTRMTNVLSSLSSLIDKSYNDLINMISKCEKNIFQKKD